MNHSYELKKNMAYPQESERIRAREYSCCRHMLRRSVLVGSSVHNQRIERFWRDSHRCVTSTFYRLFYYLEQHDLLDCINETHLIALHYVFIPRINRALTQFKDAWNHHGVRTEKGQTPNQLFFATTATFR